MQSRSTWANATPDSEESHGEHYHRLETMNQNMGTALETLLAAVNRTNARGQEELCQDLMTLYYNMSVNLERASEKIPERFECHTTQEQEEYLRFLNLNLTSMTVRTEERIQAVNESLSSTLQTVNRSLDEKLQVMQVQLQSQSSAIQTVNRSLDKKFQVMQVQLQSQSSAIQTVNRSLDEKFQVMQVQLQSQSSAIQTVNRSLDEKFQVMQVQHQSQSSAIQTVNRSLDEKFQVMQVQLQSQSSSLQNVSRNLDYKVQVMNESVVGALREHDQKLQTINETLSSSIDKINEKLNAVFDHVNENLQYLRFENHCRRTSDVCDCSDIKANGHSTSEVYRIYIVDEGQRYYGNVFCDMTTANGSWTVFQRRKDGSEDFYREWNEYANGFGNPNGEFWLGNNFLHLLTSKRSYRLRIDMEDFDREKRYAEYSTFNISSSADKYRLRIGTYSGNAGDSLSDRHNGQRFTTKDNDNDARSAGNCAVDYRGAWWYSSCHDSNLNGLYPNSSSSGGILWHRWYGYSLKTTEMKIFSDD